MCALLHPGWLGMLQQPQVLLLQNLARWFDVGLKNINPVLSPPPHQGGFFKSRLQQKLEAASRFGLSVNVDNGGRKMSIQPLLKHTHHVLFISTNCTPPKQQAESSKSSF